MTKTGFNEDQRADAFINSLARWMKGGILVIAILLVTGILQAFMVAHRQGRISGLVQGTSVQTFEINRKLDKLIATDVHHATEIQRLDSEIKALGHRVDDLERAKSGD